MIEAQTIPIWRDENADGAPPQQLVDALAEVANSRATRELIRKGEDRKVRCEFHVPFLPDCRVYSDELGRALRSVCRAAIEAGAPGDHFIVDLHVGPDSQLILEAKRADASKQRGRQ